MALLQLNIGLNVAGVERLDANMVIDRLRCEFKPFVVGPSLYAVSRASSGERTIAASLLVAPVDVGQYGHMIYKLSLAFEQDCIAGKYVGRGFLIGPHADQWGGEFNADYWLEPPAIDPLILAARDVVDCHDLGGRVLETNMLALRNAIAALNQTGKV